MIDQIFEQALLQPTFCELYSNLCFKIHNTDSLKSKFTKELLRKCQEEFEKDAQEPPSELSSNEKMEYEFKTKKRTLSNIKFIGELYKNKILVVPVIHVCIKRLLRQTPEQPDEEQLESLCKLFINIGNMIDTEKSKVIMDKYFEQLGNIKDGGNICARIRFMVEDVMEMRHNNW